MMSCGELVDVPCAMGDQFYRSCVFHEQITRLLILIFMTPSILA